MHRNSPRIAFCQSNRLFIFNVKNGNGNWFCTQKLHVQKVNKYRSPWSETRYRTFATIITPLRSHFLLSLIKYGKRRGDPGYPSKCNSFNIILWRSSSKHINFIACVFSVAPVRHKIYVLYSTWKKPTSSLDQKCASSFKE
jgi:hypothetical protein